RCRATKFRSTAGRTNADGQTVAEALSTATGPLPPPSATPLIPAAPAAHSICSLPAEGIIGGRRQPFRLLCCGSSRPGDSASCGPTLRAYLGLRPDRPPPFVDVTARSCKRRVLKSAKVR